MKEPNLTLRLSTKICVEQLNASHRLTENKDVQHTCAANKRVTAEHESKMKREWYQNWRDRTELDFVAQHEDMCRAVTISTETKMFRSHSESVSVKRARVEF